MAAAVSWCRVRLSGDAERNDAVEFELDKPFRIDERANIDERASWTYV
jgi:hypothetical protein